MLEYEIKSGARVCSATGSRIEPGACYFSALLPGEPELQRVDFCESAWQGPPAGAVAHWKARAPEADTTDRVVWAAPATMIEFFDSISEDDEHADLRYVAALLLVRRRTLRLTSTQRDESGLETLQLTHGASRREYEVPVVELTPEREQAISEILTAALCGHFSEAQSLSLPADDASENNS